MLFILTNLNKTKISTLLLKQYGDSPKEWKINQQNTLK